MMRELLFILLFFHFFIFSPFRFVLKVENVNFAGCNMKNRDKKNNLFIN